MTSSTTCRRPQKKSRADIIKAWVAGLALPPDLNTSDWADEYRVLPPESPIPGKWRTDSAPYQREPMNAGAEPDVEAVVLMWSSQVGKSEALNNVTGRHVHIDPASMMMVQPTIKLASDYADERIVPMLAALPDAVDLISVKTRDKTNRKDKKSFPGGYIVFSGANSPGSLASRPIKVILLDEIDKFKANIGQDGDPITQAIQRQENFWDSELYLTSTPTITEKSAIEDWWKKSDQRYYLVPCPHCGEHQFLDFFPTYDKESNRDIGGVRWPDGEPEKAEYFCKHCGCSWTQKQVRGSVKHGYWHATKPFNGVRGYHINSLYSFSPKTTMVRLAKQWEDSKGDPLKEQTFYNLKLGLCYDPSQESDATPEQLFERREDFGVYLPPQVLLVTAGVDVQADRVEVQWVGWGAGDEKWILDHVKIYGDPTDHRLWDKLSMALERQFEMPPKPGQTDGRLLKAEAVAVDSGNWTQKVYSFCRSAQAVFKPHYAIKGVPGEGRPIWLMSDAKIKGGGKLYNVGVDDAKTEIYGQLAKHEAGPGYIHFAGHLELDWFKQLVVERIIIEFKGNVAKRVWECPRGKRNEALDCLVYATAARYSVEIDFEARRQLFEQDEEDQPTLADLAGAFS